ncbi:glycosyl hydrolase [Paenibacillus sp. JDR-2]|uniref:glycosyl hydrolase n=1 Tax=Paenibacillus sp. (strain JDR-2) TaxID=324057 RepID=UPI0001665957|nr:glycosyl hydrolase [Paenibacillus sp. JDR-2]ACT01664.1 Glycosyl hydrolase family 32 domain protein [Paenibacillus sp. JDR-2]
MNTIRPPKAPLFRDPIHDGAADPTVIWNHDEQCWWLAYTNRRANVDAQAVSWCYGLDIGLASTPDEGRTWVYRGIMQGLEFEKGRNTFWAPEVISVDGVYHMYVTYIRGVRSMFEGPSQIAHYTSGNLFDWEFHSIADLGDRVIDACVHQLPSGNWRMWFRRDTGDGIYTFAADSQDLYHWQEKGPVITDCNHEGPNVFAFLDSYWMVTDPWDGLAVYRSDDLDNWKRQSNNILRGRGTRKEDGAKGGHPDVIVQGDEAFIFYFTHPERDEEYYKIGYTLEDMEPYKYRRTSIQVARLSIVDEELVCQRDEPFDFHLRQPEL